MRLQSSAFDTIIFDIGGVLFTWDSFQQAANVDSRMFKQMLGTQTWQHLETGMISDEDAYISLSSQFHVDPEEIQAAVLRAADSLVCRSEMFDLIAALKPGRKIYAMSNMPSSQWKTVKAKGGPLWDLFDGVFTSGDIGARKPDALFYQRVLLATGAYPAHTLFVDDTPDNIITARTIGIKSILYDTFPNVNQALINVCGDPVGRATHFLKSNARLHHSYTSEGHIIHENVSQLLILEATNDSTLVDFMEFPAECNFFKGTGQFTTPSFPNDLDTTSIYWTVVPDVAPLETRMKVMDKMLSLRNADGIPLTYFDETRPRRDHVVCVNVLSLFYAHGRGEELAQALAFIESILQSGAFLDGSFYYGSPDTFLYCLLRLVERAPSLRISAIGKLLSKHCKECIGLPGDALSLAMRLHCCTRMSIDARADFEALLTMQQLDGGWEGGYVYRYGSGLEISNRGLTTAIALRSLQEFVSEF